MKFSRYRLLRLTMGAIALAAAQSASAQTYPSKPITMIVPFAAAQPT
jgi:tripartite-type tricarboxylate transporter receptor subunit TctC